MEEFQPSVEQFVSSHSGKVKLIIVHAKASKTNGFVDIEGKLYDFVSRVYSPWVGVDEDPVCGRFLFYISIILICS